jgi:hypothetical protein
MDAGRAGVLFSVVIGARTAALADLAFATAFLAIVYGGVLMRARIQDEGARVI